MKIYLDDVRNTPEGWVRTYSVEETIKLIKENQGIVSHVSLDNDLGDGYLPGFQVLDYIEEQIHTNSDFICPEFLSVHSANPVAVSRMNTIIERIKNRK